MDQIKLALLLLFLPCCLLAQEKVIDSTQFSFGGYVKTDMINSWYLNGDVANSDPLQDFHLPGNIPVGPEDRNYQLGFHVKESRFNLDVTTKILGEEIHGFVEMDFLLSGVGNEVVSNSFNPRLRHFYLEWHRMLIGQTWSNFMVVTVPDDLDLGGAMEGLVLIRQPQFRYKTGTWSFAIENPQTTLVGYQQDGLTPTNNEVMPDVTVKKAFKGDWGNWAVAGIYRFLHYKDSTNTKHSTSGFGVTTGGKIKVGDNGDDIRLVTTAGTGLGRYQASGFVAGAVADADRDLNSIPTWNGYIAWNHYWIPKKWSSSFNVSAFQAFHDEDLIGQGANKSAWSASGNIKYTPVPQLLLGAEYMYGYRQLESSVDGAFHRLQISAKYIFGYKNSIANEKR